MNSSIISNWRPLLRAFYPLLMAITVLWAVPRNARAQLYVSQVPDPLGNAIVSEYDARTGAVINSSLITGLISPAGLAFWNDKLIVASSGLHAGPVGKYNAASGGVIDNSFIAGIVNPVGLAVVSGTSGDHLLVVNSATGTVGKYDANSGAAINASFITGLTDLTGLALLDNHLLFVADFATGTVSQYTVSTGGEFAIHGFITGLDNPTCLLVSGTAAPRILLVADATGLVSEYDADFGRPIKTLLFTGHFITGLALLNDRLFVADATGTVGVYDVNTGVAITPRLIAGLSNPTGLAVK